MDDICLVTINYSCTSGLPIQCEIPWKLSFVTLQECFLRVIQRQIHKKEVLVEKYDVLPYWNEIFLQLQIDRNVTITSETAILENIDGLLERHTVISGRGETYSGKIMDWKIASTNKERIDLWIQAFSDVKNCMYYQPLYGESEMLSHLAQRMLDSITVCDRWYYFKVYTCCFIGSEAVNWLQRELNCPTDEAIQVGNKMLNLNFFYHVVREHFFCNGYYFYRANKVIRCVKQVKKRLSRGSAASRSMSHLESRPSLLDGTGRLSEQYCVCDLYPRQSEILSQSTENLTLLVDEINTMYSFQSGETSLLSTSLEEDENQHDRDTMSSSTQQIGQHLNEGQSQSQSQDSHEKQNQIKEKIDDGQISHSSGSYRDEDDWKVGSIESQDYNNFLASIR